MPEHYEKYRSFERKETNKTIDQPVIYLWDFTLPELASGFICFIIGAYSVSNAVVLGLAFLLLSLAAPNGLRWMRNHLPKNCFLHFAWYLGLAGKSQYRQLNRPQKQYLSI